MGIIISCVAWVIMLLGVMHNSNKKDTQKLVKNNKNEIDRNINIQQNILIIQKQFKEREKNDRIGVLQSMEKLKELGVKLSFVQVAEQLGVIVDC